MRLGLPLTVVSPGDKRGNFTHIDDIIDGPIEMLPERKGNRMTADVITSKTEALGWSPQRKLADYIQELRNRGWE